MTAVAPLPTHGAVFADPRDENRSLRLSWHPELAAFVVSLWRGDRCVGTAQVPAADARARAMVVVSAMIGSLAVARGAAKGDPALSEQVLKAARTVLDQLMVAGD